MKSSVSRSIGLTGGFYPIVLGDLIAYGRYRVVHKLGFGGSSTIWLSRDQQLEKK
jgi:hypothetical protein